MNLSSSLGLQVLVRQALRANLVLLCTMAPLGILEQTFWQLAIAGSQQHPTPTPQAMLSSTSSVSLGVSPVLRESPAGLLSLLCAAGILESRLSGDRSWSHWFLLGPSYKRC